MTYFISMIIIYTMYQIFKLISDCGTFEFITLKLSIIQWVDIYPRELNNIQI